MPYPGDIHTDAPNVQPFFSPKGAQSSAQPIGLGFDLQ